MLISVLGQLPAVLRTHPPWQMSEQLATTGQRAVWV
jgi:hypothetical protein